MKTNSVKSYHNTNVILPIEDNIQELIDTGKGDRGRLEYILAMVKAGRELYSSDKDYLDKLLSQANEGVDSPITTDSDVSESKNEDLSYIPASTQPTEIESLRQEIRQLQDRNRIIEDQLRNQGKLKRSQLRAFGRGLGGIVLFLFGLGIIFSLYYYLTHIDEYTRNMYYGGNPTYSIIMLFVVVPVFLLVIGASSIYFGIRIIAKN